MRTTEAEPVAAVDGGVEVAALLVDLGRWRRAPPATRRQDQDDTDRYGRFLRHVWHDDGTNFNLRLVEEGYADAVLYEPNDLHWEQFSAAASDAQAQEAGLWAACDSFGAPPVAENEPEPRAAPQQDTAPASGPDCDPSYPGVCIPPAPPDLDRGQISERRFEVVGADPHGFDGNDNDGLGLRKRLTGGHALRLQKGAKP